jgi:hypothetical protein
MGRFAIVTEQHGCIGFVLARRPPTFEAFDSDERSLGLFDTEEGAVTAITQNMSTIYKST